MVGKAVPGGFRMQTEGGERTPGVAGVSEVRERVLSTAAELFYREGVRAVGVDLIVQRAGVAKTSLYRRSEEHTSELQSLMRISYTVFCLKKKNIAHRHTRLNVTKISELPLLTRIHHQQTIYK